MHEDNTFTVGDLRRHLQLYPDHYELIFGDGVTTGLTFYRTKQRDETLVQIEFNESIEVKQ